MIPGLLHGRLLGGGGGGSGILASVPYAELNAWKAGDASANATATFTINPDGTWASTGTNSPAGSGNWYLPTTPGAGNSYEVRITPTLTAGGGAVVSEDASNWIAASDTRSLVVTISRYVPGTSSAAYNVLVEFRPVGGGAVVSSGNFTLMVEAESLG